MAVASSNALAVLGATTLVVVTVMTTATDEVATVDWIALCDGGEQAPTVRGRPDWPWTRLAASPECRSRVDCQMDGSLDVE